MPISQSVCHVDGPIDAPLFVLGEAPGDVEREEGRGFVGPSGGVLWGAFSHRQIFREQCRVSNVYQGIPELKNGQPSARQINADWERLDAELKESQARILVLAGGVPLKRITGITRGIQAMRGYVLRPQDCQPVVRRRVIQVGEYQTNRKGHWKKGDPKFAPRRVLEPPILPPKCEYIIPILHPAGVMRTGFRTAPALRADIDRIARALRGELDLIDKVHYTEKPSLPIYGLERGWISGTVAWDIETDGENITRLGEASDQNTWTSPISASITCYVYTRLTDPNSIVICHNAAFDIPRLARRVGLPLDEIQCKVEDTMLCAQLLCPDLPKGLEKTSTLHLDLTPWKHTSHEDLPGYNAKDVYVTHRMRKKQQESLAEMAMPSVYQRVLRVMRPLWKATQRGIRVNKEFAASWAEERRHEMSGILKNWSHPEVSLGSNPQLTQLLYYKMRLPMQYGEKGRPSASEEAIEELRVLKPEHSDLFDMILEYRRVRSDLATWGSLPDRVHPNFLPKVKEEEGRGQGASTGRIQSREPNIMALPERARGLIVPDEGKILGYVDWQQAEAWVEAVTFKDEALKEALRADLHDYISQAQGIDRTRAKNFWYGSGRGAGPRKLRRVMVANGYAEVTESECRMFQKKLRELFPDWALGRKTLTEQVKATRRCRNPFGRLRVFYAEPGLPDVVGFFIQSTVADAFLEIIPKVDGVVEILSPYHDGILFQCDTEKQAQQAQDIMCQEWPEIEEGFHFGTDLKTTTQSWGDM